MEMKFELSISSLRTFDLEVDNYAKNSTYTVDICPFSDSSVVQRSNRAFLVRELERLSTLPTELGLKLVRDVDKQIYKLEFKVSELSDFDLYFLSELGHRLRRRTYSQSNWFCLDLVYQFADIEFSNIWESEMTLGQRSAFAHSVLSSFYADTVYSGVEYIEYLDLVKYASSVIKTTHLTSELCRTLLAQGAEAAITGKLGEFCYKREDMNEFI